jgi:hypothetical protein
MVMGVETVGSMEGEERRQFLERVFQKIVASYTILIQLAVI